MSEYDATMIVRFYSITAFGRSGHAAVAPEARYCAVLWRGEHRIERRHLTGSAWKQMEREVADASSSVGPDAEVRRAFAPGDSAADILATSMTDVSAAPWRVAAAIDAALREL